MQPMLDVPDLIRRRAWECAIMLRQDFDERLSLEWRVLAEVISRAGPDAIGWHYAGAIFQVWAATVAVRV